MSREMCNPFSYVKVKPAHAYLGHFKQAKFLREGHNTVRVGLRTPKLEKPGIKPPTPPTMKTAPGLQAPATSSTRISASKANSYAAAKAATGTSRATDRAAKVGARAAIQSAKLDEGPGRKAAVRAARQGLRQAKRTARTNRASRVAYRRA